MVLLNEVSKSHISLKFSNKIFKSLIYLKINLLISFLNGNIFIKKYSNTNFLISYFLIVFEFEFNKIKIRNQNIPKRKIIKAYYKG